MAVDDADSVSRPDLLPGQADDPHTMRALQRSVAEAAIVDETTASVDPAAPIGGVDQAFIGNEEVVSAAVTLRGGTWRERTYQHERVRLGYIPGLLAFREGPVAIQAVNQLRDPPELLLVDGNGRLHPRQAGLATHIGVVLDLPTIGVAKSLLCGTPVASIEALEAGASVPIEADETVDAPSGTVIAYALQTRQYEQGSHAINPIFVSPGHRVTAETAVDVVFGACERYKLPEPIRAADRYVARVREHRLEGSIGAPKR